MKDEFDQVTGEIEIGGGEERLIVPFIRSPYNYDRDMVSAQTGLECADESLAQQHMANDADINEIVRRFGITGQLPVGHRVPEYGDFTGVQDYRSALEAIMQAEESFMELPADIRSRFDNDPQAYFDFATDPANQEEIYDLGLAERPRSRDPLPTDAPQAPAEVQTPPPSNPTS